MDCEDYKAITRDHLWKAKSLSNILAKFIPCSWLVIAGHEEGDCTLAISKTGCTMGNMLTLSDYRKRHKEVWFSFL